MFLFFIDGPLYLHEYPLYLLGMSMLPIRHYLLPFFQVSGFGLVGWGLGQRSIVLMTIFICMALIYKKYGGRRLW
jgi:hypothetical protein